MVEMKPIQKPLLSMDNFKFNGDPLSEPHVYWQTVSVLQYITITTPEVTFAINRDYQFIQAPTNIH